MALRIANRARHLLIVPLNSGGTLHLAPGETSAPVEDYELDKNEKVEKLLADNLIAWAPAEAANTSSAARAGYRRPEKGPQKSSRIRPGTSGNVQS